VSEQTPPDKRDSISIVYHQRNDSPKYFEISRTKIYLFFIGLPTIALIGFIIGAIGLVNTSPFHLLENYRQSSKSRAASKNIDLIEEKLDEALAKNSELESEISDLQGKIATTAPALDPKPATPTVPTISPTIGPGGELKCPAPVSCPDISSTANPINLSTLSLFRPIQGQKNRTRPAVLSLTGFKTAIMRDTVNLQFNIIPTVGDDSKISGHIIVLMKNELGISAYPLQALGSNDFQINYSSGEPFATQRFRPVDAGFIKPRKSGNYIFTVFIFSKTGDLLHYQSTTLPLKL
jgi:hypothetical protein